MSLFNSPWFRPLTDSGVIMPGAKLKFFASETTDPEDVYADAQLNTALGNEIEADSAGRFTPFHLDPTVAYRVQLFDSADVLQPDGDVDPLFPITGQWVGEVRMHHGDLADVPAGWINCDGTGGTIDTRDRHPRGVGSETTLGEEGGSTGASSGTTDPGGAQAETTTGGTSLTEAQIAVHGHPIYAATVGSSDVVEGFNTPGQNVAIAGDKDQTHAVISDNSNGTQLIVDSDGGDPHDHTVPAVDAHTHDFSVDVSPPFFGIYFIKFVGA